MITLLQINESTGAITNLDVSGLLDVAGNLTISGNLTVNGTTTTITTAEMVVEDNNITIGNVTTPTDITANGGGITILGATSKTIIWDSATGNWTLNQPTTIGGALTVTDVTDATDEVGSIDTQGGLFVELKSYLKGAVTMVGTLGVGGLLTATTGVNVTGDVTLVNENLKIGATGKGLESSDGTLSLAVATNGDITLPVGDLKISSGMLNFGTTTNFGIVSDAITVTKSSIKLTPEAGVTDNLATISGGTEGDLLMIRIANTAHTVTILTTGNIVLTSGTTVVMDGSTKPVLTLLHDGTNWIEVSRSMNLIN